MQQTTDRMTTIYGGQKMTAARNDGGVAQVFVRCLPLRLLPQYLELTVAGDDQGVIELCLDLPAKGADVFTPEAQEALLAKCDELNFFTGQRWIERNRHRREKIGPLLQALYSEQTRLMGPSLETMATLLASSLMPASPPGNARTPSSTGPAPSSCSSSVATPEPPATTPRG